MSLTEILMGRTVGHRVLEVMVKKIIYIYISIFTVSKIIIEMSLSDIYSQDPTFLWKID